MSDLKSDEQIVFFPVAAHLNPETKLWEATVRAWVFEPSQDSIRRRALLDLLKMAFVNPEKETERKLLDERIRPFLVDNERDKRVVVRIEDQCWTLAPTESNGLATGTIQFSEELARRRARDGLLAFEAVLSANDARGFRGRIHLVEAEGFSVISDIDDTIRDSKVLEKRELMRNTFLRPFRPVDGMADLYRRWSSERHAKFHFVSANPWQLYEPLEEMRRAGEFPVGTFHLRPFRYKDPTSVFTLLDSQQHKIDEIELLFRKFPQRQFVLVGDTGEKDPEVYGELYRRHPTRIAKICLRNVTQELRQDSRYTQAMADVPAASWMLFTEPGQVAWPGMSRE